MGTMGPYVEVIIRHHGNTPG